MDNKKDAIRKDMALRGRIGGYARAAKYPAKELTAQARSGFLRRFEPTDPNLSPQERQRRTEAALKAHMARLARLSAKARRRRQSRRNQGRTLTPELPGQEERGL